jgi:NAD(P)-dependent dehydrogenase (short-subunit alcohol dehydrogenase family)
MCSFDEIDTNLRLNLNVPIYLTNEFLRYYDDKQMPTSATGDIRIVNVTSLAAILPFNSWSQYCSARAGKELYHKTCAQERLGDTHVKVLNYAPGPMDTNVRLCIM